MTTDERLEKMEGQLARVRWFNRCLIVAVVVCLAAWFILKTFGSETVWAKSGANVLRANAFVLEDENGKCRAALGMGKDGPALMLNDENGESRAMLLVNKDGSALMLNDKNGKARVNLEVRKEGPVQALNDENGKNRLWLVVFKNGSALILNDENGKPIWSAP